MTAKLVPESVVVNTRNTHNRTHQSDALDERKQTISESIIKLIKQKITIDITEFLDGVLQMDDRTIKNELKAESIGVL